MAAVWKGHDAVLARTVAIKVLHPHLAEDPDFRERFRREAVSAAKLTHPNIVSLYDTGADGGWAWLVMEYVDGATLKDVLAQTGRLEVGHATAVAEKVARAVSYAHARGLVHRDIKPANILLGQDGAVKVADFGIAKLQEADDLTRTGTILGTAAYVAPEQVQGQPVDGRTDQYAVGCVLYEALTGRQPFAGDTPVALAVSRLEGNPLPPLALQPDVPKGLEAVVLRMIARHPEGRFGDAGEAADALAAFAAFDRGAGVALTGEIAAGYASSGEQTAVATAEPASRSDGRWLWPVAALLGVAAVLVVVALVGGQLGTGPLTEGNGGVSPDDSGPQLVPVRAIEVFDPDGTGGERDHELLHLLDGNDQTTWRTQRYNSPAFGNLKPGVGFWVDLGEVHAIELVAVRVVTPGVTYELRVADAPAPTADGWTTVGRVDGAEGLSETRFDEPVTTRYLLVWVTGELPPRAGGYAAELAQIALWGSPA
jgi:eukaryotic-like serine/threonine-protein kinase